MQPTRSQSHPLDLEFLRTLVDGPNSSVLLAQDTRTLRHYAVKRVSLSSNRNDAVQELHVARILRESGGNPYVIRYDHVFHEPEAGALYLVMEFHAGGDLLSLIESQPQQRLDEPRALRVWYQIAEAVQFLHDHGVAHRDISPENVLLNEQGDAVLCDFGLSTIVTKSPITEGRVGKPYFMAPEVVADEPYDALRADIWSLGVVLFVLLTGSSIVQLAIASDPGFRALCKVGVAGILRHWHMDRLVSTRTIAILERMLQIDPVKRPQSLRELLEDHA